MIAPATPSVAAITTGAMHVREQMARDDAVVALAERARGLHVLELPHDEHLSANDARHPRPADDADRHEHRAERRLEGGGERDEQQERRERRA